MNERSLVKYGKNLVSYALKAGATDAEAYVSAGTNEEVRVCNRSVEKVARRSGVTLSLNILIGQREGSSTCESFVKDDLKRTAVEAVAIARASTENPFASLAKEEMWPCTLAELPERQRALDLVDDAGRQSMPAMKSEGLLLDRLLQAESGVARTSIVQITQHQGCSVICNSLGFVGIETYTSYSKHASAIVEAKNGEMNSGGDGHTMIYRSDLRSSEECARRAAFRARALLGATPIPTARMPVIFDRKMSSSLIGALLWAIYGSSIYDKSSFLFEKLGEQIFRPGIVIVDNPFIPRGRRSRLYDQETVRSKRYHVIDNGVLTMYLTSIESGAKLGIPSTGHASGSSNVTLTRGTQTLEELIGSIDRGFLVTDLLGHGPNIATGDYSSGAAGMLIENGEVTRPVNEVTIAGNLLDMFRMLIPASDMSDDGGTVNAPTCLVGEMTVAGS